MATKNDLRSIAASLFCVNALSQDISSRTTADDINEQGLVQISDGLYGRVTSTGESYIAVSPQGHQALLERITALRDRLIDRYGDSDALDQFVSSVKASGAEKQSGASVKLQTSAMEGVGPNSNVYGNCSGINSTGPFSARALANGQAATRLLRNSIESKLS